MQQSRSSSPLRPKAATASSSGTVSASPSPSPSPSPTPSASSSSSASASSASSSSSTAAAAASSTASKSFKRLSKELASLKSAPPAYIAAITLPTPSSLLTWHVTLLGPASTPYEHGRFTCLFSFPESYPMRPPVVSFLTPIFHVNVDMKAAGAVCSELVTGGWSPVLRVSDVCERLHAMLISPHPETPLDAEIGELCVNQPKKYRETAAQWTRKHAMS